MSFKKRFNYKIILLINFIICFTSISGFSQTNIQAYTNEIKTTETTKTFKTNSVSFKSIKEADTGYTNKYVVQKLDYLDYLWKSSICPGLGQYFLGRNVKAILFYSTFIVSGALGLYFHFKAEDTYQMYIKEREDVQKITQLYDDYIKQNQTANTFFYVTLGIWVYNIFDIIIDIRWINKNKFFSTGIKLYEKRF